MSEIEMNYRVKTKNINKRIFDALVKRVEELEKLEKLVSKKEIKEPKKAKESK